MLLRSPERPGSKIGACADDQTSSKGTKLEGIFVHIFQVILPVAICASVGYMLALRNVPFDHATIGSLVKNVGYPSLIISHLAATKVQIDSFLSVLAASATAIACFGVIGYIALKLMRFPVRAFLTPLMFGNVGNVGLPITLLALGDTGMAYTMGFVVSVLVGIFTIGMWIPAGQFSWRGVVTSPIIYAVVLALLLLATGVSLPVPIEKAFDILGGMSIPLMLLMLGHTLATLRIGSLARGALLTVLHSMTAAVVALSVTWVFGLSGVERSAFILCCFMPSSVATYLFIEQNFPDLAPDVAGFILISTLSTILVLPLVMQFWI